MALLNAALIIWIESGPFIMTPICKSALLPMGVLSLVVVVVVMVAEIVFVVPLVLISTN